MGQAEGAVEAEPMLFHVNGVDGGVVEVANAELLVKTGTDDSVSRSKRKKKGATNSPGGVVVVLDRMKLRRLDPRVYFEWNVQPDPASGGELEFCAMVSWAIPLPHCKDTCLISTAVVPKHAHYF